MTRVPLSVGDVADAVRLRIRSGEFAAGQRLVESTLARDLCVSRARMRDALQQLSAEGLVVLAEFRGASVRSFTGVEVRQVYEMREVLDGLAARLAASSRPIDDFAELRSIQRRLDALPATRRPASFPDLNAKWHAEILRLAGNDQLTSALDRLHISSFRVVFPFFEIPEIVEQASATLSGVTAAICARRAANAERLMREHIRAGWLMLQDRLNW